MWGAVCGEGASRACPYSTHIITDRKPLHARRHVSGDMTRGNADKRTTRMKPHTTRNKTGTIPTTACWKHVDR